MTPASSSQNRRRGNNLKNLIVKHTGWALLVIPVIVYELIGFLLYLSADKLIGQYLLLKPPVPQNAAIIAAVDILFILCMAVYLKPVFQAARIFNAQPENLADFDAPLLQRARNRIYNYPLLLIGATYGVWMIHIAFFLWYGPQDISKTPMVVIGLISTVLSAMLCYYSTDLVTRFWLTPAWFPDGEIKVTRRLLKKPSLVQRFLDIFLVTAFLPAASVCGAVYLAIEFGPNDAGQLYRLLFTAIGISGTYWLVGFPFVLITAAAFVKPIESLAAAAVKLARDDFVIHLPVHSDDQLGQLQSTMNRIGRELADKSRLKTLFGHYVSPVVRDLILSGRIKTDGEKIEAVVLFSDIRSFTSITEKYPAEKVVDLLNIHFSDLVSAISDNQGFVDKFIGDAMMAVFDAELCGNQHRLFAFNAVTQILQGMKETNRRMSTLGLPPIDIGLGMACGDVIRGNIGAPERKELTVIGDTVNTASRLEVLTKTVGKSVVAATNSIAADVRNLPGFDVADLDPLVVRGKLQPVEVVAFSLRG